MEETGRIHHRREPNRSSMATYSAVTRVSRSACTRPPCPRRFSNDDSRHPHHFKPPSLNSEVFIWLGAMPVSYDDPAVQTHDVCPGQDGCFPAYLTGIGATPATRSGTSSAATRSYWMSTT